MLFAFDDEAQSWALDTTSGNSAWDLFADNTRKIKTNEHVEGLAGLLARDHGHIDGARIFNGSFEGWLGDLVEGNTRGVFWQLEYLSKMPRDGFPFAVLIRCEPDFVASFHGFFEIGKNLFVSWVNFISDVKSVFIYLSIFANMPNGGKNLKIRTEVFLDSVGFRWRLYDD